MADWAAARLVAAFPQPREAAARAADAAEAVGCAVQLVRPAVLVSERHVASAALHAARAQAEGRAKAQTLGLEFLRYLSGQRQIAQALKVAGIAPGAGEAVAVALGPRSAEALDAVAKALGAQAGPVAWQGAAGLAALGAPGVPAEVAERRALELVALLDLER
jgi:KEOPS complex subunit Cgi121